jgi:hypothetical protein
MTDPGWRTLTSRLGWFVAVTFVVAIVLFALSNFHLVVPEPGPPSGETFVDNLLESFEHLQEHWVWDLASSLIIGAGFVGLAILGTTLRRALDGEQARGAVLSVTFLLAGGLGAASQLLFVGAAEVATNPEYCDCGYLAEEIVSREMANQIAGNISFWMTDASTVLFAVGLLAFASLAPAGGWVPAGLALYARVVAVLGILSVLWGRLAVPLLMDGAGVEVDFFLIGTWIIVVFAGILVPIWAAWLARAAGRTAVLSESSDPLVSTGD